MGLKKIPQFVARLRRDEGLLWGAVLVLRRMASVLRSGVAARALGAPGLHLGAPAVIRGARRIRFGRGVHVGGSIWIEAVTRYAEQSYTPTIVLGDGVSFSEGCHISAIERIEIGRDVLMGSHVYVADHAHGIYKGAHQSNPDQPPTARPLGGGGPVHIGDRVWIGDNVVIVGPLSIGSGSVIGANSVVRADIPANAMAVGSPARVIKVFNSATSTWNSTT